MSMRWDVKHDLAKQMQDIMQLMENQSRRIDSVTVYDRNPFSLVDLSERKEKLDGFVNEVSRLCKMDKSKVLHYLYRTIEENLKVSIDGIKFFYKMETDNKELSTFETVIRNNQLYEEAVRLCEETVERKSVFG